MKLLTQIFRLFLGVIFISSSFFKGVDPVGTSLVIEEWLKALSLGFLDFISIIAAFLLIGLEFVTGCALVLGVRMRFFCRVALYMMLFFTLATLYAVIFNPVSECGCFGEAFLLTNMQSFLKNIVLLLASVQIYLYYRYSKSPEFNDLTLKSSGIKWTKVRWQNVTVLGGRRMEAAIIIFYSLVIASVLFWSYFAAPVVEWGPFRVGTDLQASTLTQNGEIYTSENDPNDLWWGKSIDDSLQSNYDNIAAQSREADESGGAGDNFLYVYEKDGQRQEFSLNMLPDTTWKFVEVVQRKESGVSSFIKEIFTSKLEPAPYLPLRDLSGFFVTPLIISNYPNIVFITIYDIEELEKAKAEELVELARSINASTGYKCYIVCAASKESIFNRFSGGTGGIVLTGDYKTLLSLNRCNGGAVVVHSSLVIAKTGSLIETGLGSCSGEQLMQILRQDHDEVELTSFITGTSFVQVFIVALFLTLYMLAVLLRRQKKTSVKSFEN